VAFLFTEETVTDYFAEYLEMGLCVSTTSATTTNAPTNLSDNKRKSEQNNPVSKEEKRTVSTSRKTDLALTPEPLESRVVTTFSADRTIEASKTLSEEDMPVFTGPTEKACFGAGCYWGTEKYFRYNFQKKFPKLGKISKGAVGFMGPESAPENPSYRQVCNGDTGHVEVYNFEYYGGNEYFEALVRYFFQFHDPTTLNRQGNDRGTQYASVIYCYTDDQYEIATKVKKELQHLVSIKRLGKVYQSSTVATDIRRSTIFYPAHEEHQDYLTINPNGYCNHRMRFNDWPEDVYD